MCYALRQKEVKAVSNYTTGEIAKLCGVTVRTVQYYDTRGILIPAALSEGGRRLYSEDDLRRLRIICFLRELGLPIDAIGRLLSEDDPGSVISLLLDQQEALLQGEIGEREQRLQKLRELKSGLKNVREFSVESIGDIAYTMTNQKELRRIHGIMLLTGIPLGILQVTAVVLWITKGFWQLFLLWALAAIPYGIWVSLWYFRKVAYLCPQCHTVFRPAFREAFWSRHTPATRLLTCPKCGHHGFCVETAAGSEEADHA